MAVVVTTRFGAAGTPDAKDTHDEGKVAVVHDGKLFVLNREVGFQHSEVRDTVAIYADGEWKRVIINPA